MKLLAIETSCDETAAAVFENTQLLSNIVASQDIHLQYGGVVPELASRAHIAKITMVVQQALDDAKLDSKEIEAVAATCGPGLVGSLIVGLTFAKGFALQQGIPFLGVNHVEGHVCSAMIENPDLQPPFIAFVISGGHTLLVRVDAIGAYEIIGTTIDDAAGEAFDKVAKILGLPYPGGPSIDRVAQDGDADYFDFPVSRITDKPFHFSFSGLKTAVLYKFRSLPDKDTKKLIPHIAASFQQAVVSALIPKMEKAVEEFRIKKVVIAGGVARNSYFRTTLKEVAKRQDLQLFIPSGIFCTDNAAMIGKVAYLRMLKGEYSPYNLPAIPNLKLDHVYEQH